MCILTLPVLLHGVMQTGPGQGPAIAWRLFGVDVPMSTDPGKVKSSFT